MSISNNFKRVFKGRTKAPMWLMVAVLLGLIGIGASARTWLFSGTNITGRPKSNAVVKSNLTTNTLTTQSNQEQAVIRLLTSGFASTQVSGAAGQYRIVATRTSREEEVVLQIKTEAGQLVHELTMPQDKLDWTTTVELQSGSYNLTVSNHPAWVCHITVQ